MVVLLQEGGLEAGFFFGSEGVKVAAHIVKATQDVIGLSVFGAFEDGVLHKVGQAVFLGQLVAGASHHHQHQVGDFAFFFLLYDSNAVRKDGFIVFVFQHRRKYRLQRYDNGKTLLHLQHEISINYQL